MKAYIVVGILMLALPGCVTTLEKASWVKSSLAVRNPKERPNQPVDFMSVPKQGHPFYSADFQKHLDHRTNSRLSTGNELKILANHLGFAQKISLMERAQHNISVATHQIICDEAGNLFTDKAIEAAGRGVHVRVLLEGSFWGRMGSSKCVEKLRKSKVDFRWSHNYLLAKSWTLNIHDKIFVMDTEEAITGGQNIGSWWGNSTGQDKNFRDTDVWVKGPVAIDMERKFLNLWHLSGGSENELLRTNIRIALKERHFTKTRLLKQNNYDSWLKNESPGMCRFVHQEPFIGNHHVADAYTSLAQKTKRQAIFQVPAVNALDFPKNALLFSALGQIAKNKNGQTLLMTNGRGYIGANMLSSPFSYVAAWVATNQLYDAVHNTKIDISLYDHWMHSKLYYFDGLAVAIGSFNLDHTVAFWSESTLICMDDGLIEEAKMLLKNDISFSNLPGTPGSKRTKSNI